MQRIHRITGLLLLLPACAALTGCGRTQAQKGMPQQTPDVSVSGAVVKEVTDYEDFPGRIEPVSSIEVRARVTGYLDKVCFKDGADVKEGDVLFEIDPRPYKAELARSEGSIIQAEGRLLRLKLEHQRVSDLLRTKAASQEEFDRITGDRTEARGALEVARASRDTADLNLKFTKVKAAMSGRISRSMLDPGNLVKADDTPLTTIVSLDPVYAYFDLDERSTLKAQRLLREGKVKWDAKHPLPIYLGLADEEGRFPRRGEIDFADNRVDPDTGTWRLRAVFKNRDHSLYPGLFVRIRLPIGEPYDATLVAEQALIRDQGQTYVFVIGKDRKADYRRVTIGRIHHGLRVISEGLKPGEQVVVKGLQRVRPGIEVKPHVIDMPVLPGPDQEVASRSQEPGISKQGVELKEKRPGQEKGKR